MFYNFIMKTFFLLYLSLSILFVTGVVIVCALHQSKKHPHLKRFINKHIIDDDPHLDS
jgi:hypothetical protein